MNTLLWLIGGVTLVGGVSRVVRIRRSLRRLARPMDLNAPRSMDAVVVLIPVLREQDRVLDVLDALLDQVPPPGGLTIMVITTERERHDRELNRARLGELVEALARPTTEIAFLDRFVGLLPRSTLARVWTKTRGMDVDELDAIVTEVYDAQPSTSDVVEEQLEHLNARSPQAHVVLVERPGVTSSEALQENYALESLGLDEEASLRGPTTYVGLFAADGIPPSTLFSDLTCSIERRRRAGLPPAIHQLVATYVGRNDEFPAGPLGLLRRAAGVHQTSFVLAVEATQVHRADRGPAVSRLGRLLRPYAPVIGHGMFVRADRLARLGGMPTNEWCEDIMLSCLVHLSEEPTVLLRGPERNEVANTLRAYVHQSGMWFTTASRVRASLGAARRSIPQSDGWLVSGAAVRKCYRTAEWAFGPVVWLVAALASISQAPSAPSAGALIGLVWFLVAPADTVWQATVGPCALPRRVARVMASVAFYVVISPLGPWRSMFRRATRAEDAPRKTER